VGKEGGRRGDGVDETLSPLLFPFFYPAQTTEKEMRRKSKK